MRKIPLHPYELVNAALSFGLASRFAYPGTTNVGDSLLREFTDTYPNDWFWVSVFVGWGLFLLFLPGRYPRLRLAVRIGMLFWWSWVAAFLTSVSANLLATRWAMAMMIASALDLVGFVAAEMQKARRGDVAGS